MENLTQTEKSILEEVVGKLKRHYGRDLDEASKEQIYKALSLTLRDMIMEKRHFYRIEQRKKKQKELYYLSFEFLMGRSLSNNLLNMGLLKEFANVVKALNLDVYEIARTEPDAGLGSGGLGRLAACFLDSLTTLEIPAFGSSIRYEYGLFKQKIVDGYQIELPDTWLKDGSTWEIERPEEQVEVRFGGTVNCLFTDEGMKVLYNDCETVIAMPYDVPISGYNSDVVNTLRLWSSKSKSDIDLKLFSGGDYIKAYEEKALAETLSKVLYPEDNHAEGKALRLKQQYFFVSATVQWIISRFKRYHGDLRNLPEKVVIHINDTHPALAIPEMMRILMDEEGFGWDEAWDITRRVFAYTNHTIMNEALEKWPMKLFARTLPRIWMIIDEMNNRLVTYLRGIYGDDFGKINYMSIVAHDYISMPNLCLATCYAVNGVSKLHTEILTKEVFADYYNLNPSKYFAITNGITFRRWLKLSNKELSNLITEVIGEEWILDEAKLKQLEAYSEDIGFQKRFMLVKQNNKTKLAKYILDNCNIKININSIFDIQAKRLHEYKRQLLNILHILYLYNKIKENPDIDIYPRTFIFAAKASPGYERAKLIIKLINSVADLVNNDLDIKDKIKVVFIENYGVSIAESLIAAADVSEQISTAGKEASGTGNMKFMLNGALTIGTLDGANVEMLECAGEDNIYIFGMTAKEVNKMQTYNPDNSKKLYSTVPYVKKTIDMLIDDRIEKGNPNLFYDIYQSLIFGHDPYMVLGDFESYIKMQEQIEKDYRDPNLWWKKSIINVANAGFFSSDRTIKEYNEKIWKVEKFKKGE